MPPSSSSVSTSTSGSASLDGSARTLQIAAADHQLVKYMKATLSLAANDDATLLQKIPVNVGSGDAAIGGESDADELAEATRVVVALGLGIAKSFEDGVGLQYLSLQEAQATLCGEMQRRGRTDRGLSTLVGAAHWQTCGGHGARCREGGGLRVRWSGEMDVCGDGSQILYDFLGTLGLARPGFTADARVVTKLKVATYGRRRT
jgi:hypothetical protein